MPHTSSHSTQVPSGPRFFRSPLLAACLLGIAIIAGAALRSPATPTFVPPPPTPVTIGLVDLARLLDGLHESKVRNDENQKAGQQLQTELNTLTEQIEKIKTDLQKGGAIPENDYKARSEALAKLFQKTALLKASRESYQTLYDTRRGNIIHEFYDKIVVDVDAFAKREGYDLILLDDRSMVQLPPLDTVTAQELLPLIEKKRILFAKEGMDVTERLITIMNNKFDATAPAPINPAPAPAPAAGSTPPPAAGRK